MKRKSIFLALTMIVVSSSVFAQTAKQKALTDEYNRLLNRIQYAQVCGFCFDGTDMIPEVKTKGSEHSFFIENPNVYLKVQRVKDKKFFYTRCFELVEIAQKLYINENYALAPSIKTKGGHWNFLQLSKDLNVTVCTDQACQNVKLELYETNEKPIAVEDGIFVSFASDPKKCTGVKALVNASSLPALDKSAELKKIDALLQTMEKYFTADEIKTLRSKVNTVTK